LSWARSSYLIGNNPVLYRTFVPASRLGRLSTRSIDNWSPSLSVDQPDHVTRLGRFMGHQAQMRPSLQQGTVSPPRGFTITEWLLSLRSPSHVCVRNTITLPVSVVPTLKYHIRNIAQRLWFFFSLSCYPGSAKIHDIAYRSGSIPGS
jgi:hypothetical protein